MLTFPILILVMGFTCSSHAMTGDATYYYLGLTACGEVFTNDDLVAAVAYSYFKTPNPNNDPMCNKKAVVTDPESQISVTVRIKDKCQGCRDNDIDLSPAAFERLRELGVGRFTVDWYIID